jgi:hypothetical protein
MMNVLTMALGAVGKGVTIPLLLLLLIPALVVLAGGGVVVAVLLQRMLNRAVFTQDEVAIGRLERILKAVSAAVAEVLEARQRRGPSLARINTGPPAEG